MRGGREHSDFCAIGRCGCAAWLAMRFQGLTSVVATRPVSTAFAPQLHSGG